MPCARTVFTLAVPISTVSLKPSLHRVQREKPQSQVFYKAKGRVNILELKFTSC